MKKTASNRSSHNNSRRELFQGVENYESEIALHRDQQDETTKMKLDLNKGLDEALSKLDLMRELVVDMKEDLNEQEKQIEEAEREVHMNVEKVAKANKQVEKETSGTWFTSWLNKFFE